MVENVGIVYACIERRERARGLASNRAGFIVDEQPTPRKRQSGRIFEFPGHPIPPRSKTGLLCGLKTNYATQRLHVLCGTLQSQARAIILPAWVLSTGDESFSPGETQLEDIQRNNLVSGQ